MSRLRSSNSRIQHARRAILIAAIGLCLATTTLLLGQAASAKPISKSGLTHALQIGGLTQKELADQVIRRGVDFPMTTDTEAELRHAGADASLIDAVKENYRAPGGDKASTGSALEALDAPDKPATVGPAAAAHASGPAQNATGPKHVVTLRDVRKLYIEKMPNGLDAYLRAAISEKTGSFFTVVLDRSEADAILQSTDPRSPGTISMVDPSGKVVLWSGSADDKERIYLNFRHGGQRQVAEKLATQLRRALE